MTLPKAILFDMDDTLISFDGVSERVWRASIGEAIALHGLDTDAQVLFDALQAHRSWYWSDPERHRQGRMDNRGTQRRIVAQVFSGLGLEAPEAAAALADAYTIGRQEAVCLFPQTIKTLDALRAHGVRLGLVTNGTAAEQRRKIARFGLEPYFECILIEGELGFGKPDRRVFELALEHLGLPPGEVWMVGDNLNWEIGPAQALGLRAIWVDWRGGGLPPDSAIVPDQIVQNVGELL